MLGRLDAQVVRGQRIELGEVRRRRASELVVAAAAAVAAAGASSPVVPAIDAHAFAAGGAIAVLRHLEGCSAALVPRSSWWPRACRSPGGKLLRSARAPPPPEPRCAVAARGGAAVLHADGGGGGARLGGALGVAGVGPQDGWFALGGTSLAAVRMLRTLQQTLGASADGDEQTRNQRFATRLCGLYPAARLRGCGVARLGRRRAQPLGAR